MKKVEDIIKEKFGRENHFRVPEGYFDDFTMRMMAQLPNDETATDDKQTLPTMRVSRGMFWWKPLAACAACLVAITFSAMVYMNYNEGDDTAVTGNMAETNILHDEYIDEVADFAMMDNTDIAALYE
ncbi:MAG: hypothetical protein ACI4B3_02050 [Prevotella sp.]